MKKRNCVLLLFLSCLLIAQVSFAGGFYDHETTLADDTDQIIIKLKNYAGSQENIDISEEQMGRMEDAGQISLQRLRRMSGGSRVLALPRQMSYAKAKIITSRLEKLSFVEYAEPDRRMHPLSVTPNDPYYAGQWHYFEPAGGINLPEAWALTQGSSDVVVAVIDTGILEDHEDLAERWSGGYDFISMRFNARDRNGRDLNPNDEGDWTRKNDSSWHGSHVAGTIGAEANNGVGVAGIDWNCQIVPIRVLGRLGGFTSDIVDGIRWAAGLSVPGVPDNPTPAHVINMSLGGAGSCDYVYQKAVNDAVKAGTVVVVAAGNSSDDAAYYSPASCNNVITVAATDRSGDLAWYSNYGQTVAISAPGGETAIATNGVLSTLNTGLERQDVDDYAYYQGTSMASPHVAGVIALMLSVNPSLTPYQILSALQRSSRPFPSGTVCAESAGLCGAGILDAKAAIESVMP